MIVPPPPVFLKITNETILSHTRNRWDHQDLEFGECREGSVIDRASSLLNCERKVKDEPREPELNTLRV